MKFKHLLIYSAIIGTLGLSGCGGSGSSAVTDTSGTPISTAFKVNVQVPDGLSTTEVTASLFGFGDFFISEAAAATVSDELGAGNFKVAIVDAAGVVTEVVTPESISQEPDGTWILTLAGGRRVDCVIIADVSKTPDVTVGQTLPADAIYAPTASEQFDIDIRSTAAFQEFIETVEDSLDLETASGFTEEDIAALVEKAQELPLPTYNIGDTLEEYLADAIVELEAAIEREIIVVSSTDTSFSLANFFEAGSVLNWYYSDGSQTYERGQFSYNAATQATIDFEQEYDSASQLWVDYPVVAGPDGVFLTASGWQINDDLDMFESLNADGSITLADTAVPEDKEVISGVKIDVAGQRINLFIPSFNPGIASDAVFSAGAESYLLSFSTPVDTYEIWADDDGNGGVVTYPKNDSQGIPFTAINDLFSATASTSTDPAAINMVTINEKSLELVGSISDTSGTVNIYTIDYGTFPYVASVIGTTTWERRTVLGEDIVLIDNRGGTVIVEDEVDSFYMLALYNGSVVEGDFIPAGEVSPEQEYVFNDTAAMDINSKFVIAP